MTAFVFVGNGKSDPEQTTVFGYKFELNGSPVEVDDKAAGKLATNSHFKVTNSLPTDKSELEAIAAKFGVELDKRKTVATLQRQVQELIDGDQDSE